MVTALVLAAVPSSATAAGLPTANPSAATNTTDIISLNAPKHIMTNGNLPMVIEQNARRHRWEHRPKRNRPRLQANFTSLSRDVLEKSAAS
jgi:hypothetical protein